MYLIYSSYILVFSFKFLYLFHCCCLATKSCPTLFDLRDCSTSGFPILHYLPKFVQIHVHWVGDVIQPFHLLLPPSSPIFPSIRVFSSDLALLIRWPKYWKSASASVFSMNIQVWFSLRLTGLISLQSNGLLRVLNITVWKHWFFSAVIFMVELLGGLIFHRAVLAWRRWLIIIPMLP